MQAGLRSRSGADVRTHRNVHADKPGSTRKDRAEQESCCRNRSAAARHVEKDEDQDGNHCADHRNRAILAAKIGLRAFLNGGGNFLHLGVAGRCPQHLTACDEAIDNGYQPEGYR